MLIPIETLKRLKVTLFKLNVIHIALYHEQNFTIVCKIICIPVVTVRFLHLYYEHLCSVISVVR